MAIRLEVVDAESHFEQIHAKFNVTGQTFSVKAAANWLLVVELVVDEEDALRERVEKYEVDEAELAQISHDHVPDHGHEGTCDAEDANWSLLGV